MGSVQLNDLARPGVDKDHESHRAGRCVGRVQGDGPGKTLVIHLVIDHL